MTAVVLGGAGFLGLHLVRRLLEQGGGEVRVLDHTAAPAAAAGTRWTCGDFTDAGTLQTVLRGAGTVYHLVSTTLPNSSNQDPVFDLQTNLVGTVRLLEACVREKVKTVVFVSSGGTVYGIPQTTPIPETHPNHPLTSYGISKLAIEKYLALFRHLHGLDYRIVRLSNPYGEGQLATRAQGAVAVFLHRALTGQPIEIWGDGSVVRDYVYVDDAVGGLLAAARYGGRERLFNIGSGQGLTLTALVEAIGRHLGSMPEVRYSPSRPLDVPVSVLDISRAREELRWAPQVALEQGIARSAAWMRAQLAGAGATSANAKNV